MGERFDNGEAYKSILSERLYLKPTRNLLVFDTENKPFDGSLNDGMYSVIVHVTGIYIGSHGSTDKNASLQVGVKQIQYEPQSHTSLFAKPSQSVKSTAGTGEVSFKPLIKRRKVGSNESIGLVTENNFEKVDENFINKCDSSQFLWKYYLHMQRNKANGSFDLTSSDLLECTEQRLKTLLGVNWLIHLRNTQ